MRRGGREARRDGLRAHTPVAPYCAAAPEQSSSSLSASLDDALARSESCAPSGMEVVVVVKGPDGG